MIKQNINFNLSYPNLCIIMFCYQNSYSKFLILIFFMQRSQTKSYLSKQYLNYLEGPILFTAPHSKKVQRGGALYGFQKQPHAREVYTSFIAVGLAKNTKVQGYKQNSFCVWGNQLKSEDQSLDPNYLIDQNMKESPFHRTIHKWIAYHMQKNKQKLPALLHIDIHGKKDRQHNCQIEIGFKPMKIKWKDDPLINMLEKFFENDTAFIFENQKFGQYKCQFNTDPQLHGYWGGKIYTMTQQAITLGIPSFQVQLPTMVRQRLFTDSKLLDNFRFAIQKLYCNVVVPYWQNVYRKTRKIPFIDVQLANNFICSIVKAEEVEKLYKQLIKYQSQRKNIVNQQRQSD